MNKWKDLMNKRINFEKAMATIVDTYQHETGKVKLGMSDIDELISVIKVELYHKNGVITDEMYEEYFKNQK